MKRAIAGLCWTVLGLLLSGAASGCMWDTDTLANEAKGLPDVVQVITGRFARNPPLFYEMRLKRVTAELNRDPGLLDDYDDAAVACDRLSRDDEALTWMQKKRARLERAKPNTSEIKEQWYRYYANIGTFRAHRWLRAGADQAQIAQMKAARDEIAKAIKINPDAHFGREKVQLAFMEWLIAPGKTEYASRHDILDLIPGTHDQAKIRKGLCGLIVLGNAWESLDAFLLLTDYGVVGKPMVQYLACLRCQELLRQGHHSLHPERITDAQVLSITRSTAVGVSGSINQEVEEQYRQLRAEAESWQKRRTDYMMARLKVGSHPDTDPTFWTSWKDTPPPSLELPWYRLLAIRIQNPKYLFDHSGEIGIGLLSLAAVLGMVRRVRAALRKRKLSVAEPSGPA